MQTIEVPIEREGYLSRLVRGLSSAFEGRPYYDPVSTTVTTPGRHADDCAGRPAHAWRRDFSRPESEFEQVYLCDCGARMTLRSRRMPALPLVLFGA